MSKGTYLYHDKDERGFDWGESYDLDLGDGHYLRFTGLHGVKGKHGAIIIHTRADAPHGYCSGGATFDTPESQKHLRSESEYMHREYPDQAKSYPRPTWKVESWDPLTLSPSFLCHCGDHGFIKQGKWVRA